jgi:hypothetical protein
MHSNSDREHFVTLFDSLFLPAGIALHSSLMRHAQPFHLWIICMDTAVESALAAARLDHVSLIPLEEAETAELRAIKPTRNKGEYCWTVTPNAADFVFARTAEPRRVTYVDADIFFFDPQSILLKEFDESGKHVLITDHAYDPKLDQSATSGRFCVQFMTFRRTPEASQVSAWWRDRCLEWCYDRCEDGKFGDQKYLDDWPNRFSKAVHVLKQTEKTLAPWNARYFSNLNQGPLNPVMYHFQSLRFIGSRRILLYKNYSIPPAAQALYEEYVKELELSCGLIEKQLGNAIPFRHEVYTGLDRLRHWVGRLRGTTRYVSLSY